MIRWVWLEEPPDIAVTYMSFDREQPFLLPPDVKDWLAADDIAHFIVAAVERVRLGAFHTNARPSGKPQYHPRLMLAREIGLLRLGTVSIEPAPSRQSSGAEHLRRGRLFAATVLAMEETIGLPSLRGAHRATKQSRPDEATSFPRLLRSARNDNYAMRSDFETNLL